MPPCDALFHLMLDCDFGLIEDCAKAIRATSDVSSVVLKHPFCNRLVSGSRDRGNSSIRFNDADGLSCGGSRKRLNRDVDVPENWLVIYEINGEEMAGDRSGFLVGRDCVFHVRG